jgi:hypothetical protein
MSRISFPGRKVVVQQVQGALGILADGDDRVKTWQAIAFAIPLSPVPTLQVSSSASFSGRDDLVKRVQRALGGILVDGDDGQETWSSSKSRTSRPRSRLPQSPGISLSGQFSPPTATSAATSCKASSSTTRPATMRGRYRGASAQKRAFPTIA